jgi:hypothetical protein
MSIFLAKNNLVFLLKGIFSLGEISPHLNLIVLRVLAAYLKGL